MDFETPEVSARKREPWLKDVPAHVAEFLAKGGQQKQCEPGESAYAKKYMDARNFVIDPRRREL